MKIYHFIAVTILLAATTACQQIEFEPMDVNQLLGQKIDSTYSIARLKKEFATSADLFSAQPIPAATGNNDIIINGIVTSSDTEGNVYKYLTIQEEIPGGQALKISVDVSGLSGIFPLGQRVAVRANGLFIGNYAQSVQMGVYYENTSRFTVLANGDTLDYRVEPGRMPKFFADRHIIAYGLPDPAAIVPDTMTIAQILAAGNSIINKVVTIKNAFFTGKGANFGAPAVISEAELIFAPSTDGVGYPQSREIQDGTGSIFVSTSEYAKFAQKPLPTSNHRGHITAIVGWYNDRPGSLDPRRIYHQLTLRSLKDLGKGFEQYHQLINE